MQVYVAGAGKLATELLSAMEAPAGRSILPWSAGTACTERSIVIHAGSGRELGDIIQFCTVTGSTLVDAATTSPIVQEPCPFPFVDCPNANLLIVRFMAMVSDWGGAFTDYNIQILESHQRGKTSPPGTAYGLAQSLGVSTSEVVSVRSPDMQRDELGIPEEHLGRHAFHRIVISDDHGSITLETKVLGPAPYAAGLSVLVAALCRTELSPGKYSILDLAKSKLI